MEFHKSFMEFHKCSHLWNSINHLWNSINHLWNSINAYFRALRLAIGTRWLNSPKYHLYTINDQDNPPAKERHLEIYNYTFITKVPIKSSISTPKLWQDLRISKTYLQFQSNLLTCQPMKRPLSGHVTAKF